MLFLLINISLFSQELIVNGGFTNGDNWSVTGGFSISTDTARYGSGISTLIQTNANMASSIEALANYKLEFDCVVPTPYPTGYASMSFYSTDYSIYIGNTNYYNQHYILYFTTPASVGDGGLLIYSNNTYDFKLDNISLVKCATIGTSPYYVHPNGNDAASGNIDSPWRTWQRSYDIASAGDTVWFRGGTYYATEVLTLDSTSGHGHSGTANNWIYFMAYPGETPILDYSQYVCQINTIRGLAISYTTYIYIKGLTFRNIWQREAGITASGVECYGTSNLTFENVTVHNVGGRGFGFFGGFGNHYLDARIPDVSSDTVRYINCDAYDLYDSLCVSTDPEFCSTFYPGGISDGFKFNNRFGSYVRFENCRSWNFSDNGFDPNGNCLIEITGCLAFNGGWVDYEGNPTEGSGFKYGNQVAVDTNALLRILTNNISACNHNAGYDENNSRDDLYTINERIDNNVSYNNAIFGVNFSRLRGGETSRELYRNNISYMDTSPTSAYDLSMVLDTYNSWNDPPNITITGADFIATIDSSTVITQLLQPRKSNGSLADITVFRLTADSDLKGAGTNVGMSAVPDIGIDWAYYDSQYPSTTRKFMPSKNGTWTRSIRGVPLTTQ